MPEVVAALLAIAVAILAAARMICAAIRRSDDERSKRLQLYVANASSVRRQAAPVRSAP